MEPSYDPEDNAYSKSISQTDVVVHAYDTSTWVGEEEDQKFKAGQGYSSSLGPASTTGAPASC